MSVINAIVGCALPLRGDDLDLTGPDRLVVKQRFARGEAIGLLVGQGVLWEFPFAVQPALTRGADAG